MGKLSYPLVILLAIPSLGCPDYWIVAGDSCYKTSLDPMTWYDAQQYCADQGGYMIEIRDEDEQASLFSFLQSDTFYWIGLTDLAEEGTWVWQTNFEDANYTHWMDGQPGAIPEEDCAHLWGDFLWNDYYCDLWNVDSDPAGNIHALCETENEK